MRAYQDFREFLAVLDQEKQLLRITDPMQPEPDLAAAAAAATKLGNRSPALLFNNIGGYSDVQLAMNVRIVGQPRVGYGAAPGHGHP
jgi:4-hydroxybenzoate decarboxylase